MGFPCTADEASRWVLEAAASNERIATVFQGGADAWLVHFEAGHRCRIEFALEPPRFGLSMELAAPARAQRKRVQEAALNYSLLWRDNGGMRVAQVGEDGPMVLLREVAHGQTPREFAATVERFAAIGIWWLLLITSQPAAAAPLRAVDFLALRA